MKPIKHERGQSLVELGISMLILVYLLAGAAEFGVLFFQFVQLRDAAQEGALYGSTSPTSYSSIELRARSASNSPVDLTDATKVDVSVFVDNTLVWKNGVVQGSTTFACENHGIRVTVDFKHQIFMPFMAPLLGRSADPTIPLSASVTDTILTPPCP
jgi:Flp pilus assembly protein TadG